jgi:hypothetical protein
MNVVHILSKYPRGTAPIPAPVLTEPNSEIDHQGGKVDEAGKVVASVTATVHRDAQLLLDHRGSVQIAR